MDELGIIQKIFKYLRDFKYYYNILNENLIKHSLKSHNFYYGSTKHIDLGWFLFA